MSAVASAATRPSLTFEDIVPVTTCLPLSLEDTIGQADRKVGQSPTVCFVLLHENRGKSYPTEIESNLYQATKPRQGILLRLSLPLAA